MKSGPALVLVTTSFPISGDGSEAAGGFVADLAEALGEQTPVRVVAPGPSRGCESWANGVTVHRYEAPERPLSTLRPWRVPDWAAIRSVIASGLAVTRDAVEVGPTEHILALWALPSGHWARRVSKASGVPYSVWTLGSDIWSLGRIPIVRGQLRRVLRDATRCYSDGLKLAEDTKAISGRAVDFLPSTRKITATRAHPRRTTPPYRLLFLGRWHPNKGVDLLLDALNLLEEEDWSRIELIQICGGGPMAPEVTRAVGRLAEAGRPVIQRGFLDKPMAEFTILNSDFLLIPSRIESIPVVFSDAMKLGCPAICTPTGDLPRLLSMWKTCGVLAKRISSVGMAEAIRNAVSTDRPVGYFDTREAGAAFSLEGASAMIIKDLAEGKVGSSDTPFP